MATIKNMNNQELVKEYTNLCFLLTNYPNNKSYNKKWFRLFSELCNRLNISEKEILSIQSTL